MPSPLRQESPKHHNICAVCNDIFAQPRQLTYGTYYAWGHTVTSYSAALTGGCHLCTIVEGACSNMNIRSTSAEFLQDVRYAFKVLNWDWACFGEGKPWLTPPFNGDYEDEQEVQRATIISDQDPTDYKLATLLCTDSDELFDGSREFWLVLQFTALSWGDGSKIVLPLELCSEHLSNAETIAQRDIPRQISTGTRENLDLAKHWLQNCVENHPGCQPTDGIGELSWLPTRLLYVGSPTSECLRLVSTSSLKEQNQVSYAVLSHRWGEQKDFVLTLANLQSYQEAIQASKLSRTLQEAIQVSRHLGLEYLWVDCMCIIQDDDGDWARESTTMSKVYGLATCTIAAANSGKADSGCFSTRNPYRVRPCLVPNPFNPSSSLRFAVRPRYLPPIYEQEVQRSQWYNRGWVFQERTLSHRLLIFGKTQMLWACQGIRASESWPTGKTSENFIDRFDSLEVDKARLQKLLDPTRHITTDDEAWPVFIKDYTIAKLTRPSDRLMALEGLASRIGHSTGRGYSAGIWLDASLPMSLLWTTSPPRNPRSREYRAPSWSWASVDCPINFNLGQYKGRSIISNVSVIQMQQCQSHTTACPVLGLQLSGCLLVATMVTNGEGKCENLTVWSQYGTSLEPVRPLNRLESPTANGIGTTT
ncbi:heterokaryon incompatibility protein-domain-containing protein [Dactylonectria macrodidyma]|uniref:Heterokaryon incompatibility protein-domain-containing protein n=1 Tax=Dactylonectria macrodidyma TaxID=307937 RepID=A0A9P9FVH1_9HYPO|nr:heterokaryon incompatibility protein-domain-containing protein [Dactylonectria macrodidyma]